MTAYARVDLHADQYVPFRETYFVVDPNGTPEGTPRTWATLGSTATLEIRRHPSDPTPLVSISTAANAQGAIALADDGSIAVEIERATMITMPTGVDLGYDLIVTTGGVPEEILKGAFRVEAGNNRS